MTLSLADAVAAYTAGVDALLAADVDTASHRDLLAAYSDIETAARRTPMTGYAILARLDREADPRTLGATSLTTLIAYRTRISKGEVGRRRRRARHLIARRTLQGETLTPLWEHTATALAAGSIGDEHVEVIRRFLKALPTSIDPTTRSQAEQTLAEAATTLGPDQLTKAATVLLGYLHPDGDALADAAAKKVGLHLGNQQPDGTSYLSGWVSPTLRALIEPIQAKFAERGRHPDTRKQPVADDPGDQLPFDEPQPEPEPEPEPDDVAAHVDPVTPHPDDPPLPPVTPLLDSQWRTRAQYTHDAFETALDLLLRSGTLGTLNGLPTTVVVTTTLQELEAAAGYALTGGGSRLPMRDLIAMAAAGAYHYLAVFDGHTAQALHLGRAQRCATGAQKLMLFGRERGCTCPGCTVEFYRTQAHHGVAGWKRDGQTNVDDLTLACGPGNQMIEDTGWSTRRRPDGRFAWIDPVTSRAHLNNLHHPERLLKPPDDDPF